MTTYFRAWVVNGDILTVYSQETPITHSTYQGPCDFAVDAELAGEYVDASTIMAALSVSGQNITGLDFISYTVLPGTPAPHFDIVAWRATLQCTPAQMRLTLHRAGLLATVQAIADSDPEAKILWEYATQIIRNSPFIDALGSASFTPTQIDDLFVAAMSA